MENRINKPKNMKLENITKESMKNLSEKFIVENNVRHLLNSIKEQAELGKTKLFVGNYNIEKRTKEELEKRGFKVEIGGRSNESNTNISWS